MRARARRRRALCRRPTAWAEPTTEELARKVELGKLNRQRLADAKRQAKTRRAIERAAALAPTDEEKAAKVTLQLFRLHGRVGAKRKLAAAKKAQEELEERRRYERDVRRMGFTPAWDLCLAPGGVMGLGAGEGLGAQIATGFVGVIESKAAAAAEEARLDALIDAAEAAAGRVPLTDYQKEEQRLAEVSRQRGAWGRWGDHLEGGAKAGGAKRRKATPAARKAPRAARRPMARQDSRTEEVGAAGARVARAGGGVGRRAAAAAAGGGGGEASDEAATAGASRRGVKRRTTTMAWEGTETGATTRGRARDGRCGIGEGARAEERDGAP